MNRVVRALCLAMLAVGFAVQPGSAQSTGSGDTKSIWDGVYTQEQAERGQELTQQQCMLCHTQGEWTAPTFLGMWNDRSIRGLYDTIRLTMPYDMPGRFSREEYAEIMAYLLRLNDLPTGDEPLPSSEEGLDQIYVTPEP